MTTNHLTFSKGHKSTKLKFLEMHLKYTQNPWEKSKKEFIFKGSLFLLKINSLTSTILRILLRYLVIPFWFLRELEPYILNNNNQWLLPLKQMKLAAKTKKKKDKYILWNINIFWHIMSSFHQIVKFYIMNF